MKKLLKFIITNIVEKPEDVEITEENDTFLIKTAPPDVGRVIGKGGKIIKAIRNLARILAVKRKVRINIDVQPTPQE